MEAGPADGEPVLLLHGEPSWSFLYRKVMPVLADAGLRAIASSTRSSPEPVTSCRKTLASGSAR